MKFKSAHPTKIDSKSNSIGIECISKYIFAILLLVFFLCGVIYIGFSAYQQQLIRNSWAHGHFQLYLLLYIGIAVLLFMTFKNVCKWSDRSLLIAGFFMAFIPRLLCAIFIDSVPVSDFGNYYIIGEAFLNGKLSAVADIAQQYEIPSFGGMAVLNGTLMRIFSQSQLGFRIAQCFLSASMTIPLYLIGKKWDKQIGILAAILFACYPANILYSSVYTNQHGAILFVLLSVCFLLYSQWNAGASLPKTIGYTVASSLCLVISYFFHPSWQTHIIAIAIYLVLSIITAWRDRSKVKQILTTAACLVVCIPTFYILSMQALLHTGIIYTTDSMTMASKLLVGFNEESGGGYAAEDYYYISDLPRDQRTKVALTETISRIKTQKHLLRFLGNKVIKVWYDPDSSFYWYNAGVEAWQQQLADNTVVKEVAAEKVKLVTSEVASFQPMDTLFSLLIYFLAAAGVVYQIQGKHFRERILIMLLLLGWISVHMLIEVQGRYRYFGVVVVIFFAAAGVVALKQCAIKIKQYVKEGKVGT